MIGLNVNINQKFIKNMKKIFMFLSLLFVVLISASCTKVAVNADEEAALVMKPWFFGHGGVYSQPVSTGLTWCAPTTDYVTFKIVPQRYDEKFDDIFSNDNTPLDFNTYITIQIEQGKTPILLQNYGAQWYVHNIQVPYRNKTREYVSMYSPFDLISNREVISVIDSMLLIDMREYVANKSLEKPFPINIVSVTTGAARPNQDQLDEMNNTAAAIQKTKTQERLCEMEKKREAAEKQRAVADKAYMREMGLTADQYIELRAWNIIEEKQGTNIDVLFNGSANSMWNIRR